ncbi:MAG: hypothetical protein WD336_03895 [Trueperaceae bacterium]
MLDPNDQKFLDLAVAAGHENGTARHALGPVRGQVDDGTAEYQAFRRVGPNGDKRVLRST